MTLKLSSVMPSRRERRKIAPPPPALAVRRKQVFNRICPKDLHQASRARITAISAGDWTMDPGRRRLTGYGTTAVPKPAPSGPPCPPVAYMCEKETPKAFTLPEVQVMLQKVKEFFY